MGEATPSQQANQPGANADLAEKLGQVHVGVRRDLEVSRHIFRNSPAYIIRDPITFQAHHLTPQDYSVLVRIDDQRNLAEIYNELVAEGTLESQDAESFYRFIVTLHRLGFLNLPISDDKTLYRRFEAKQSAQRRQWLMAFLMLRVPVFNPDAWLEKTAAYARPLFSKGFFAIWLGLMGLCAVILAARWDDVFEPLNGIMAANNLLIFWGVFVALKVIHEFGHAYACKLFGGHVPEMGVFLIAFTPCAYVDATASWGFTRKRDRIIVSLAGVYVESIIAAVALFIWCATGPSAVNTYAYHVFLLAGIVTLAFNINPLMRFDGYYLFSDMLEIPNLRSRASAFVRQTLKRFVLGVRLPATATDRTARGILLSYGVASSIYRVTIVVAIAGMIASKLYYVGLALGIGFLAATAWKTASRSARYLWWSAETAPVRVRARVVCVLLLIGLPLGLGLAPVPVKIEAPAWITTEVESVLRASTPGFVRRLLVSEGQAVLPGDPLLEMENFDTHAAVAEARAQVEATRLRLESYRHKSTAQATQERELLAYYLRVLEDQSDKVALLRVTSDTSGFVAQCIPQTQTQRYLAAGEPVATICGGRWIAKVLLPGEDFAAIEPVVGLKVPCRTPAQPSRVLRGTVIDVAPAGSRLIALPALTHLGGGSIAVDPGTGQARQPYFEVTLAFSDSDADLLRRGMTAQARFDAPMQTVASRIHRRLRRFLNLMSIN